MVAIVGARLFIPLLIPRLPLVIVVVLVLDAADQTLLATYTDVDTSEAGAYQSVDKALDIYYLSIAYLSAMRNWTSNAAFRIAQFLFYYRLVGVVLFELTDERLFLLIFPNTFEYFFIAYELARLRFDPSRISARFWLLTGRGHLDLREAAAGVLDPHRQARLHRRGQRPPGVRGRRGARAAGPACSCSCASCYPRLPDPDWGWRFAARSATVVARRCARALRTAARERPRADARGVRAGLPARRCCA